MKMPIEKSTGICFFVLFPESGLVYSLLTTRSPSIFQVFTLVILD